MKLENRYISLGTFIVCATQMSLSDTPPKMTREELVEVIARLTKTRPECVRTEPLCDLNSLVADALVADSSDSEEKPFLGLGPRDSTPEEIAEFEEARIKQRNKVAHTHGFGKRPQTPPLDPADETVGEERATSVGVTPALTAMLEEAREAQHERERLIKEIRGRRELFEDSGDEISEISRTTLLWGTALWCVAVAIVIHVISGDVF
jgi:hypothetical protein